MNHLSAEWDLTFKVLAIVVPAALGIIMFGVALAVRELASTKKLAVDLLADLAEFRGQIGGRLDRARDQRAELRRRLDDHAEELAAHDETLVEHGRRLTIMEGRWS